MHVVVKLMLENGFVARELLEFEEDPTRDRRRDVSDEAGEPK